MSFLVLGATRMPALLLECLFLDDTEDAALLARAEFRRQLGEAVAAAAAAALRLKPRPGAPEAFAQGRVLAPSGLTARIQRSSPQVPE